MKGDPRVFTGSRGPNTSHDEGGIPISSWVSLRAVANRWRSSSSLAPPGKETCPEWRELSSTFLMKRRWSLPLSFRRGTSTAEGILSDGGSSLTSRCWMIVRILSKGAFIVRYIYHKGTVKYHGHR